MFGPKIKLDKEFYERLRKVAEISGYSSVDEFAIHILEKELDHLEEGDSDEDIKKNLEGLGYIS